MEAREGDRPPQTARTATFDIPSMYTNVDNDLGMEAIQFWLEKFPEIKPRNIPDQFIINAIRIVLEQNTFKFDNRTFLHICGTAMGTKCALVYATMVIAFLEVRLYDKFQECFGLEARQKFQKEWMRYLDDCFIYWDTRLGPVTQLHDILNSLHDNTKFTIETNHQQMNFLDIKMLAEKDKVITDRYFKPTDTHNYVPFNSTHPKHTLRNIPYNLARRLCTIVEERETLEMRMNKLQETLILLGYPLTLIKNWFEKAKGIPQERLRTPKEKILEQNLLTFVSTNNPRNPQFFPIIKESISILNASPKLKNKIENTKIIPSKRQPQNLKRILTRAKFTSENRIDSKPKVTKCDDKRCETCKQIVVCSQVVINKPNKTLFNIKNNMDCGVRDFIYVNGCGEKYIGESGDTLRHRATLHRNQISILQYRKLKVSKHIAECAKNKTIMFTICPFFKLHNQDETYRKEKESYFISKCNPSLNK